MSSRQSSQQTITRSQVDFVFVIYAGYGENYGAPDYTVWPHAGRLSTSWIDLRLDGRRVNLYACSSELRGSDGARLDGIGALCHEFGHVLGLPDLYNSFAQDQIQLGQWDVMDIGSYNNESRTPPSYTAFKRHQCGWLDFIDLTEPAGEIIVPELTQNNVAYCIATDTPDEFFTLENHQRVGWDSAQAGTGLMIIHVKYDSQVWQNNTVNTGATPHYDLVEADGTPGKTYETDLFPIAGHDAFTDYSTPSLTSCTTRFTIHLQMQRSLLSSRRSTSISHFLRPCLRLITTCIRLVAGLTNLFPHTIMNKKEGASIWVLPLLLLCHADNCVIQKGSSSFLDAYVVL